MGHAAANLIAIGLLMGLRFIALNVIQLCVAVASTLVSILGLTGRIRYLIAQLISVVGL